MGESTFAIDCQSLSKHFGDVHSLRQCTFQVQSGQVFGLLGPNGAGKTTLLRTLLGFLSPTAGSASVFGFDICSQPLQVRSATAYLPGEPRLARSLTGSAILELFSGLHPKANISLAKLVAKKLELDLSRRVMFMSTGMRQKLALSIIFGNRAPLVILDEPTANLDPNIRVAILELISGANRDGRTVVLSSHIFSDIDSTCDEVAILHEGALVAQKSMSSIGSKHIVTGTLSRDRLNSEGKSSSLELFQEKLAEATQVGYWNCSPSAEGAGELFELHVDGDPQHWLTWLANLGLARLQIERAGVRAFYQQVHQQQALDGSGPQMSSSSTSDLASLGGEAEALP